MTSNALGAHDRRSSESPHPATRVSRRPRPPADQSYCSRMAVSGVGLIVFLAIFFAAIGATLIVVMIRGGANDDGPDSDES